VRFSVVTQRGALYSTFESVTKTCLPTCLSTGTSTGLSLYTTAEKNQPSQLKAMDERGVKLYKVDNHEHTFHRPRADLCLRKQPYRGKRPCHREPLSPANPRSHMEPRGQNGSIAKCCMLRHLVNNALDGNLHFAILHLFYLDRHFLCDDLQHLPVVRVAQITGQTQSFRMASKLMRSHAR